MLLEEHEALQKRSDRLWRGSGPADRNVYGAQPQDEQDRRQQKVAGLGQQVLANSGLGLDGRRLDVDRLAGVHRLRLEDGEKLWSDKNPHPIMAP